MTPRELAEAAVAGLKTANVDLASHSIIELRDEVLVAVTVYESVRESTYVFAVKPVDGRGR